MGERYVRKRRRRDEDGEEGGERSEENKQSFLAGGKAGKEEQPQEGRKLRRNGLDQQQLYVLVTIDLLTAITENILRA